MEPESKRIRKSSIVNSDGDCNLDCIDHLESLREEDIQSPITIRLRYVNLNEDFLQELWKTFEHYAGYPKWKLKLFLSGREDVQTLNWKPVITEALCADRIHSLMVADGPLCGGGRTTRDYSVRQLEDCFQKVAILNLETLELSEMLLTEGTLQLISKYLMNGSRILHLRLKQCRFESIGTQRVMPGLALLAEGFAANTTLESIMINPSEAMEDGKVAILLRGLISHPRLQRLELWNIHFGTEMLEALHRIFAVASTTRTGTRQFKHLKLFYCPTFDMEGFVKLLHPSNAACAPTTTTTTTTTAMTMTTVPSQSPYWCPLQCLDLSWNTLTSTCANMLLRTLLKSGQSCPNLERVNLVGNHIDDWSELTKDLLLTRIDQEQHNGKDANTVCFPCPLRTLDLTHFDLRVQCTPMRMKSLKALKCIYELMEAFPQLGSLGNYISFPLDFHLGSSNDVTVAHELNLRRFWGVAFPSRRAQDDREIPLSLWPLLLAKPPLWEPASVIFKVLQEYGVDLVRGPRKWGKKKEISLGGATHTRNIPSTIRVE